MDCWYVAFGSNLLRERFICYLEGGRPPGARHENPGARDPSPPRDEAAVILPGTLWFADRSQSWGGAVAFYDDDTPGPTLARAYRLTVGQLADVMAQELGQPPGALDPLPLPPAGGRVAVTPGRYGTLVDCGVRAGLPLLTLTAPWRVGDVPPAPPSLAYLGTIARGLAEIHDLDAAARAAYLAACPGVGPTWSAASLAGDLPG